MEGCIYTFDCLKNNNSQLDEEYMSEGFHPFEDYIEYALLRDDKEQFVDYMKDLNPDVGIPDWTQQKIFFFDSVKCATAVVNGETSPILDYNAAFCYNGLPALHNAAAYQCPKLTKLFLEHNGAEANLRWDCESCDMEGMLLPLNVALEKIRKSSGIFDWDWTPKRSVFKLVYRLCASYLRFSLENVRLLAQKTNGIDKEIKYYSKEGKVVELAALLMVAREKVMTTPLSQENNFSGRATIRPFLLSEIASLSVLDARSTYASGSKKEVHERKNKKAKLEEILLLLEIFERIGEKLTKYLQLEQTKYPIEKSAKEVAWIFKEGGFDVKCDLVEDIQRIVARGSWFLEYEDKLLDNGEEIGPPFMRWRSFFDDTDKLYRQFPTRKSYQQALSASLRDFRRSSVKGTFVLGSRSYHALPITKANLDLEPMIRAKKIYKVQNLQFNKLFLSAFTRTLR